MAKVTVASVNKELKRLGHPERLVNGNGYFYFTEGTSLDWRTVSEYVFRADELTLAEWIETYNRLKADKF
jgi:hypothetical protein